ncbi:hypothetical protein Ancab_008861 [Ancistrocladus abbreviatus]
MDLINEATSNPHLIFCFCNLIIVLLIIASPRTISQSPLDGHQYASGNISPPIDADIATERDNQEITVAENHSAAVDSYCKGEEDEPSRRIEAFIDLFHQFSAGLDGLQHVESVPASGDNSISDSNIHNMNRIFLEKDGLEIDHVRAEEVWAIGRALGVSYDGNEQELLQRITNMEMRDKAEWEQRK